MRIVQIHHQIESCTDSDNLLLLLLSRYLGAVKPSSRGDTEGDWSSLTLLHQEDQCLYSCSSVPCCNTCKHHQVAVGPASPGHFKHSTLSLDSLKEGRGCCCCYREVVPAGCVTTDKHSDNNKPPQSSAVEIPGEVQVQNWASPLVTDWFGFFHSASDVDLRIILCAMNGDGLLNLLLGYQNINKNAVNITTYFHHRVVFLVHL